MFHAFRRNGILFLRIGRFNAAFGFLSAPARPMRDITPNVVPVRLRASGAHLRLI